MSSNLEAIRPRQYQQEVFNAAREGNVIAALGTGSGKTFIAVLLIRWMASTIPVPLDDSNARKLVLFLVPKVPLVDQQATFIESQSPLRVTRMHGGFAWAHDWTDREAWKKRLNNGDVFIMTPQICLNLLTHSLLSMSRVSLIIFDEAHHARKSHPYATIAREHIAHLRGPNKPKVFGMTASPIWNPKDPKKSIETLEQTLSARVIGIKANIEELATHTPKPKETILAYPPSPSSYTTYPEPTLYQCVNVFRRGLERNFDIAWPDIDRRYHSTLLNLGIFPAEYFLFRELKNKLTPDLSHVQDIVMEFSEILSNPNTLGSTAEWYSPKLCTLASAISQGLEAADHGKENADPFRTIVFVEQRHVVSLMSTLLPQLVESKGLRCAGLVGNGGQAVLDPGNKTSVVDEFRTGSVNVLIATSVAEEGLDFQACTLVIRFDPVQHLIAYIQSRGRARNPRSQYIVMAPEDDTAELEKLRAWQGAENVLTDFYTNRAVPQRPTTNSGEGNDEDEEMLHPHDAAGRERYSVAETGALLHYENAVHLLGKLCSMLQSDSYGTAISPAYDIHNVTDGFMCTLRLPSSFPIPPRALTVQSKIKFSKREAKRSSAFRAVKMLHEDYRVIDDYLLPLGYGGKRVSLDAEGKKFAVEATKDVPAMMQVRVKTPWSMPEPLPEDGQVELWIHPVTIRRATVAGLITGLSLPTSYIYCDGSRVAVKAGQKVLLDPAQHRKVQDYVRHMIWLFNTGTAIDERSKLTLGLVPVCGQDLSSALAIDWATVDSFLAQPRGSSDWDKLERLGVPLNHQVYLNVNTYGRVLVPQSVRLDLTPMSKPEDEQAMFDTYFDYFTHKWTRKAWIPDVPVDGPMVEVRVLKKVNQAVYATTPPKPQLGTQSSQGTTTLLPLHCCRWLDVPYAIQKAYRALSSLAHHTSQLYRAQKLRFQLSLPYLPIELLIEAFSIPSANLGYNNQRFETLGDAVLQLCTTVHLFHHYPYCHEGQLTRLRQRSVSNRFLLASALRMRLQELVNTERLSLRSWRYVMQSGSEDGVDQSGRCVSRIVPRRSLQDCMEAVLGVAFIHGGISTVLHTGFALGLTFGGPLPWHMRYRSPVSTLSLSPSYFDPIMDALGYQFHRVELLLEAVTHPSFTSNESSSYERLEFLGDAILDLVVMDNLFSRFPRATSHQLSRARQRAICSPALAYVAVKRLSLHKVLLCNSPTLGADINKAVTALDALTARDIVDAGWSFDPPKVLSDLFESVLGAIFIDCGHDYDKIARVVTYLMDDILECLSPNLGEDPMSRLSEWMAKAGCLQRKVVRRGQGETAGMYVEVHGTMIVKPMAASSSQIAKGLAAERALNILQDEQSDICLARICTCKLQAGSVEVPKV